MEEGLLTRPPHARPRHGHDTSQWRPVRRNVRLLAAGVGIAALAIVVAPPDVPDFLSVLVTMAVLYACVDAVSLFLTARRRRLSVRERYERRLRRRPWLAALVGLMLVAIGVAMAGDPRSFGDRWVGIAMAAIGGVLFLGIVATWTRRGISPMAGVALAADRTRVRRGDTVTLELRDERDGEPLRCGLVCAAFFDVPGRFESRGAVIRYRSPQVRVISTRLRRVDEDATRRVRIPADGPFSFEGESLSVVWTAVALVPGTDDVLDAKDAVEVPIEVLP